MDTKKLTPLDEAMQQLSTDDEQAQFKFFYFRNRKSLLVAYLLLAFLGVFGFHKLYLNKKNGWAYLLFCWTLIPMLFVIVDIFLLPFQVTKYNRNLALNLVELIKKYGDDNHSLINIDKQLRLHKTRMLEWQIGLIILFGLILPVICYSSLFFTHHRLEIHYKTINPDGSQSDSILSF